MQGIYHKYNADLLTGADNQEAPEVMNENLELVAAMQNLNAISHQFGLDPTIQIMGLNITESTPGRSRQDCQNTPSAVGTVGQGAANNNINITNE